MAVGHGDVGPDAGGAGGDAGEVAKAAGGKVQPLVFVGRLGDLVHVSEGE